MPPVSITIPQTYTASDPKPHTVYAVQVKQSLRTTTLDKRYSDFVSLHSKLTSAAGGTAPPAPLPPKSWFGGMFGGGTGDAKSIEDRRQGLEAYLRAIISSKDARWRDTVAFSQFLGLSSAAIDGNGGGGGGALGGVGSGGGPRDKDEILSASEWLSEYNNLKRLLQDSRVLLTRREQASTPSAQHEASVGAKKALLHAISLIARLERALQRFAAADKGDGDEWDARVIEKLGDGEVRRRRDLLGAARKEREGLDTILTSIAVKSAATASTIGAGANGAVAAVESDTRELFRGAHSLASNHNTTSNSRRVLGAPLPETNRTRELDNQGVLQLQQQTMRGQEQDVSDLTSVVRRMKDIGIQMNEELVLHNEILNTMEEDVGRVDSKIRIAKKRTDAIR